MTYLRQIPRSLSRSPAFTILSVLTLAVGIAACAAIFAVVDTVLLRPLPYPEPERLAVALHDDHDVEGYGHSEATYVYYREHNRVFDEMALYSQTAATLTGRGDPERLRAATVTASLFPVLRVAPALGRAFHEDEERPGAPPVVVLSDGLWRRRFGAEPEVLGRTIEVDGVSREVVGVLPPGLTFPERGLELWLPQTIDPRNPDSGRFGLRSVARLRDGVSLSSASADLNRLVAGLEEAFPGDPVMPLLAEAGLAARVTSLRDQVVGRVEARLWILFATMVFVLAVAVANVTNLFVVRAEGRRREVAVRTAFGAARARLAASAFAESVTLAALATLVGLAGAWLGVRLLVLYGPRDLPRLQEIGIDGRVLAFTAAVAFATGLVLGVVPAVRSGVSDLASALKDGGRSATAGRRVLARQLLVGAQVALALVLLVGCGVMVKSFLRLSGVDPGFRPANVLSFDLSLPESAYAGDAAPARFFQELLDRIEALPGVESAGAVSQLPMGRGFSSMGHSIEDFPETIARPPDLAVNFVAPGYFRTLGIELKEGRYPERADHERRTGAVLVSVALARHYWPGESALGKRLMPGTPAGAEPLWYTVVGVVGDVRSYRLTEEPPETVYYPMLARDASAWSVRRMTVVVRSGGEPTALAGVLRRELQAADASLPFARVRTLEQVLREAKAPMAFTVALLGIAAAVSLLLGAVGTFGIVSHLVSRRTAEIGLRMALGARRGEVLAMVLREGLRLAVAGGVVGIAAALVLTRWLESILFEVSPLDPWTFLTVPFVLLAVALAASWMPARRAARIEPVTALRHE